MSNLIKSSLYTGVGTFVQANEKFKELIEGLIQNNELTQDEGRRVINIFINSAEDKKIALENQLIDIVDKTLITLKMPPINELEIKFADFVNAVKNKSILSFLKKEIDNSPAIK